MKTDDMERVEERNDKDVRITVTVNKKDVNFVVRRATGMHIKKTAIDQGVNIKPDFVLYEVKGHERMRPVGDNEEVTLNKGDEFRAVAPDDNS